MKTNKGKVFVKRWAVRSPNHFLCEDHGLVNFLSSPYTVTGILCQLHYEDFLTIFGIPLTPEVVYSLKVDGTARPYTRKSRE